MTHTHAYRAHLSWAGSTADGYEAYERTHRVVTPPALDELALSSDPAFEGDAQLPNPEQLLVAAASSCQLLMFLAIAARSRVDVVAYEDEAEGVMPEDATPMRITLVTLRPTITIAAGGDLERAHRMVERAHDGCYIANTLNAEVVVEAVIEHLAP